MWNLSGIWEGNMKWTGIISSVQGLIQLLETYALKMLNTGLIKITINQGTK